MVRAISTRDFLPLGIFRIILSHSMRAHGRAVAIKSMSRFPYDSAKVGEQDVERYVTITLALFALDFAE